jgi:hypothetical protein
MPLSWGFGLGVRATRSGAGEGAGKRGTPPLQRFLRSWWVGEGLWAYQEGQMGQKIVRLGLRGTTRSRQCESKEVHEVGSKRPSLGCNGVHVVWWIGLIFRLLHTGQAPAARVVWKVFACW